MAGEIQRRPRSGGVAKFLKKWTNKLIAYSLPALRYGIMPAAMYYAINYTEPRVSFFEIVNPFW